MVNKGYDDASFVKHVGKNSSNTKEKQVLAYYYTDQLFPSY